MHIADPSIGIFGANGIVAAGLPIAVGSIDGVPAPSRRWRCRCLLRGRRHLAQGAFHEAVNLAAVWKLPVVFWCENNGYAEFSPAATQYTATLERRAAGYGVDYVAVDGNDVTATASVMRRVVEAVRDGGGPAIVEASTYRWHGHYEGDPQRYREQAEVDAWKDQDPIVRHADALEAAGFGATTSLRWNRRWPGSSTRRSRKPGAWPHPTPPTWATS